MSRPHTWTAHYKCYVFSVLGEDMADIELLPLHLNEKYEDECADILNEEWPRSKTARLHMLQKSNANFPYSIVMVCGRNSDKPSVIGHSRLCVVSGRNDHAFVDSVLVKRSLRGRGYGKMLMKGTEDIAKSLGISRLYLTTHDKQDFYAHIGYTFCKPIVTLGAASNLLSDNQIMRLFGGGSMMSSDVSGSSSANNVISTANDKQEGEPCSSTSGLQLPPPPPAPPPPPPPPTIPPPPPPPLLAKHNDRTKELPVRLEPSKVHWMLKDIY